jgi:hypothetical protein
MTPEIAPGSKLFRKQMRHFTALALLFLGSACTTAGAAAAADPRFRSVANAAYASRTERGAVVAADEAAYRNAWDSMIGMGEAPAIDFTSEKAVFLFGGQRSTGGYSVEVRGVTLEGDTLVVDGGVKAPPPGSITTQALTSPYAVIAVESRAIRNVRWTP